jgi:biotin carboxyl carrier protein
MGSVVPVRRIAEGVYLADVDGRTETVYVAGPAEDRWAFWNGRVFRGDVRESARPDQARQGRIAGRHPLTAPMPATVIRVHVKAGDAVKKGDILVLLEAMKMELPIRAPGDAKIAAVHCRDGELVPADAPLIDLDE